MKKSKKIIIVIIAILVIIGILLLVKGKSKKQEYEIEKVQAFNYYIMQENGQYGIIDKDGNTVIEAKYNKIIIPNPEKDTFICYEDEKAKIINSKNEVKMAEYQIEPIKLKNIASTLSFEKTVAIYKKDDLYGLISYDGREITKNIYTSIEGLQSIEGEFLTQKDGKYGLINLNGNEIIKNEYDLIMSDGYYKEQIGYSKSGYIVAKKSDDGYRYGYIDYTGKEILDVKYNAISRINQIEEEKAVLLVQENGRYGIYKNGKEVIKPEYQSISYDENSGLLMVEKNKKYGMLDLDGKEIIPIENTKMETRGIYIYAELGNENKVYDKTGNTVNIGFNKSIYETENETFRITTSVNNDITYYGITKKDGTELVPEKYRYIEYAYENFFIAKNDDGKLGIIDENGNEIVELKYDLVQKIKGKNMIQTLTVGTYITEIYSRDMNLKCTMENAQIQNEDEYIKVYSNSETKYFDKDGNELNEDSEIIKNSTPNREPEKIGDYKKVQVTLDSVYYVKE